MIIGSSRTSSWRIELATTDWVTSTSGAAAVTVSVSWRAAIPICRSTLTVEAVTTSARPSAGSKPPSSARTSYGPGISAGIV